MPLLGSIMTIDDAGSQTTAASSTVYEENMTWHRIADGSTSSLNEAHTGDDHREVHHHHHQHYQLRRLLRLAAAGIGERGTDADQGPIEPTDASEVNNTGDAGTVHLEPGANIGCDCARLARLGDRDLDASSLPPFLTANDTDQVDVTGGGEGSTVSLDSTTGYGVSTTDGEDAQGLRELELLFGLGGIMEDLGAPYNDSFNQSAPFPWNSSDHYNDTYIVFGESMYPSGYTLPHIVLASVVATLLMIVIVVGNMLVIIAIATEKALKNIQNWFIASLAVADFFLGLVIMPFSLANEIMGYWIFGYWWCDIYSAMDVLLCTASIMNLCLISLDRFWSITQAVKYLKKRTPARAALMIALVWLLSALVCIPPLLGWKRPTPEEEYPKCKLSEDIGYVLYSALGSFYIPSCIMVFVYIRIYFAAKKRARRGIRKQPRRRPPMQPESPDVRQTSFTQTTPATETKKPPCSVMENVATIENQPVQIPIVTCDCASDVSTSEADPGGGNSIPMEEKDTLKVTLPVHMQKTSLKATLSVNGDGQSSVPARCRAPSVGIDVDMVSEFDPSSSDSGVVSRCAVVKPLKLRLCQPIFGRRNLGKLRREHGDVGRSAGKDDAGIEAKSSKSRDPEREKRRLARKKEKRATLILGIIMGSFIACWLPFFVLYIVKPLFPDVDIPTQAFVIAFWLGYMNSALNPFIYTVFNKDFRRAFRRILFK
ncbi:alpha2-adrenergic-like octopamine receptor [Nomia melanderi]|uniref:alpha2-adrenergic-like octopamine receptor n=1 Tax=Nomia melanderi TaxID=2448451 RepID=UPI0013045575|nr:alpha-2B adrenergic receptor [Nomia melanderi]